MSLNNEQMLPARSRNMRQMNELLNAEDTILTEIECAIDEMYERAAMLHEELVNEEWLEKKLEDITAGIVTVKKKKDILRVEIYVNVGQMAVADELKVRNFLNKWLPAHLEYVVFYEKTIAADWCFAAIWQDDEIVEIRQVQL